MVDIEAAVRYPLEDEDWIETVGIGGGILLVNGVITFVGIIVAVLLSFVLIGFLLFPVIGLVSFLITLPLLGFGIRILRSTIRGEDDPPRFDDWGDLFTDGIYALAISLVYAIPLIVVSVVLFLLFFVVAVLIGAGGAGGSGADPFAAGGSLLFVLGQFVYFGIVTLYGLAMTYVVPISLAIFAHEDDFRTAFSFDRIRRVGLDSEYAIPWLVAVFGAMVVNNFAGFLVIFLVGFFVQFYVQMVVFRLFGVGYVEAMDLRGATSAERAG